MDSWKTSLNADATDWLLEEENPSVRHFALKDLLDKPEDDAQVQAAKRDIMQIGIAPDILRKQREAEYLRAYPRFYTDKYKGLVWQLIVLAELGATRNPQIQEQCEYLLNHSQEAEDGGFAMHTAAKKGGGRITEVIPCLTGNMVWSLIRFGYLKDPRLRRAIAWLARFMRFNDGTEADQQAPPYGRYEICWGRHTCFMGAVKTLKGLSAIPREQRSSEVTETINRAAEFFLLHHIYKQSHNLKKTSKPGWLKFSFPLMYQTDALEILDLLTGLGVSDSRMDDAVKLVLSKQDEQGRWRIGNTENSDRLLVPIGHKGEQSKWLTLRAMRVLKRYGTGGEDLP